MHDDLPRLRITLADFENLPEYSRAAPETDVLVWKRLDGAYDPIHARDQGRGRWLIGQYLMRFDTTFLAIRWSKPVIIVRGIARAR